MPHPPAQYVELQAASNYSFLRGASHPEELFLQARAQGHAALAITDHATLAGMVRAHLHAAQTHVRLIVGARVDLTDGSALTLYPRNRAGYANLCGLLTLGKRRAGKGGCHLAWPDIANAHADLMAILLPGITDPATPDFAKMLAHTHDIFGAHGSVALVRHWRPRDAQRLAAIANAAYAHRLSPVVTNDVLYHTPQRRMLQDTLCAIRNRTTIDDLGVLRQSFAGRHLQTPAEMCRLFARYPAALARTIDIATACQFSLNELRYQYPAEAIIPGLTPQQALETLTWQGAQNRYGVTIPAKITAQLHHELSLIGQLDYAPYFLTVHSIVMFARSRAILCQGRGSAANSAVCYVLGITAIDPAESDLLFERFISAERREPPDIDVDFEHDRREEVIQWIFETYGRDRAALCATTIRYRGRGATRDVARAMGFAEDTVNALTAQVSGWSSTPPSTDDIAAIGLDARDPRLALTLQLAAELIDFPRHLSQHPGGFVLTQDRLDTLVPIEPAAMADRQIIEWDKDDIDVLRFMKVDVLALGMLSCLAKCFAFLGRHKNINLNLATIPQNCAQTYAMIQVADTVGVFQIESRAQMSMLPRLKPACFYDLVIEVAIVRPGPIQGDMVHPYLRRREGREAVTFPTDELRSVLGRTLGVPLFQEQAMKIAIICAGFTPGEADQLRRSMATFKMTGGVAKFRDKMLHGMVARGYTPDFADRIFRQIEGFGSYGFPESHAASFALLTYVSCWLKWHHPDIFCAALLNAQPMGFYAPAQIVRDAEQHGVKIYPISINHSRYECTLEHQPGTKLLAVRLGFCLVKSLTADAATSIATHRGEQPFANIEDFWRRTKLSRTNMEHLAAADAFACLNLSRRQTLWQVRALPDQDLPLFAAGEHLAETAITLTPHLPAQSVIADYRATGLSLHNHPLIFLRETFANLGLITAAHIGHARDGSKAHIAGLVLVRQKPSSAKGVMFMTIEDETGTANLIIWPSLYERQRRIILAARLIACRGMVQREGAVIHLIANDMTDFSTHLDALSHDETMVKITARNFH